MQASWVVMFLALKFLAGKYVTGLRDPRTISQEHTEGDGPWRYGHRPWGEDSVSSPVHKKHRNAPEPLTHCVELRTLGTNRRRRARSPYEPQSSAALC